MRKRLRAQIELLLLPSNQEKKKAKAAAAAAAPSGKKAAPAKSTPDAEARRQAKNEKLAAIGLGPLAKTTGEAPKRKASKELGATDNKKQKGAESGAAATEEEDPEIEMEVSGPGPNQDVAGTSESSGKQTKKPFNKVVMVSHHADKNPFTLSVHRYTESKDGKRTFSQLSKDDWYKGLYPRISKFCDAVQTEHILKIAEGKVDSWSPKILHNYHENGHGVIIPKDERTCKWLSLEILPQIMFKQGKLSIRLRTPAAIDNKTKKTLMVRFTIQMPHGTFTNGKDSWWSLFCYWNGLSSGTKFHETFTRKSSGQTLLAFYCTEQRAAFLWHPDPHCETGFRRGKTVVISGGGAYADIFCGGLNVKTTKELTWEGITNSLTPIAFDEEIGEGINGE